MSLPRSLCFPADSTTMSEMFDSNLPADWYNFSSGCSEYDAALAEAERQATASGSIGPLVKQELRLLIQTRRLSQGKEELRVGAAVSTTHELTAQEEKRKLRRKEQNRCAAQRFRKRKKFRECALSEDIVILQDKNTNLRSEVAQLRQLKDSLLKALTSHASVCPHIPDVFSSRPHGNVCPSVLHVISPSHHASVCLSNHDVNIPSHLASVCISGHDLINPSHQANVCSSGQDIISPSHQANVCSSGQDIISPSHQASVCPSSQDIISLSHQASVCPSSQDIISPSHKTSVCLSSQDIISPSHQASGCSSSQDIISPSHQASGCICSLHSKSTLQCLCQ